MTGMSDMGAGFDPEDFDDFLARVNAVDEAVKGLKEGTVSVDEIDTKQEYKKLLEEPPPSKRKQQEAQNKKEQQEADRRKALAKLPKSVDDAEKKVELAKETKDINKIKKAEEDLYIMRRREQKQTELDEWEKDKKDELREQYKQRQKRRERWELWAAANPECVQRHGSTNYEAWDNWEPEDEWDDMKDELMPNETPALKAMEEDCNKRAKARRERIREAESLKNEGNLAFKEKRYQNATELYGAALKVAPWMTANLTNRAMCYIHLRNFKNAVRDCKDALSVADWNNEKPSDPIPLKALMRRGQAYAGLGKFDKAVQDLERALEIAPDNKGIKNAIEETRQAWGEAKREEAVAQRAVAFQQEAMDSDMMQIDSDGDEDMDEKVDVSAESAKKKEGGVNIMESPNDLVAIEAATKLLGKQGEDVKVVLKKLEQLLGRDDDNRIHFRSVQGFKSVLPLLQEAPNEVLEVLVKACLNEKNIAVMCGAGPASQPNRPIKDILALLSHEGSQVRTRAAVCIALCSEEGDRTRVALTEAGAGAALVERVVARDNAVVAHCLRAIKCLSGDAKFRGALRENNTVIGAVSGELKRTKSSALLEDAAGSLALLCNDPVLRRQMDTPAVLALVEVLRGGVPDHVAMNALGALLNACADAAPRQFLHECDGAKVLLTYLVEAQRPKLVARAAGVLARMVQYGSAARALREEGAIDALVAAAMGKLQHEECQVASVRCLAAMCTKDPGTVQALTKSGLFKALPGVITALDSTAVGNVCMIISQCAVEPENLKPLGKTVEPLVTVMHKAANEKKASVAKNAAIALAKLAKHPKHLERIRELHGIEIMMAYIKP